MVGANGMGARSLILELWQQRLCRGATAGESGEALQELASLDGGARVGSVEVDDRLAHAGYFNVSSNSASISAHEAASTSAS